LFGVWCLKASNPQIALIAQTSYRRHLQNLRINLRASSNHRLRPADSVEATGIIGPGRIAKIERAVREVAALQWLPPLTGQIRAGFQHDGDVGRSHNFETKTVGLHTEAGVVDLKFWVP